MLFTGVTDVLNQERSEDSQKQAPVGTSRADGVAAHIFPVGLQACRLIGAYVPSLGIYVVSMFTSPSVLKPFGCPTLTRCVELDGKIRLKQLGNSNGWSLENAGDNLMKPQVGRLLFKVLSERTLLERDGCQNMCQLHLR